MIPTIQKKKITFKIKNYIQSLPDFLMVCGA